mmetsp:Transcript_52419/g.137246  ORF Transcript_52419/g.137246 Transcript_52419/m.137246 type:complete len:301 (-) Transcript_52419:30-932(-)
MNVLLYRLISNQYKYHVSQKLDESFVKLKVYINKKKTQIPKKKLILEKENYIRKKKVIFLLKASIYVANFFSKKDVQKYAFYMKILICEIKINLFTVSMCVFNIKIMLNNIYVKYKLYVVEILNVIRKKINLLQSLLLFLKKKNNEIINKLALKILFLANKNCFLNENDFLGKYFLLYKKNKFLVYRFMQEIENFSSIISLYETEQFLLMYKQHLNYSQRSIENIKKKNIVLFYPTFFLIAFERFRKSTIFLVKTAKKFSKYYLCKIPLFLLFEIIEILLKLIKVSFIRLKYIKIFYFFI